MGWLAALLINVHAMESMYGVLPAKYAILIVQPFSLVQQFEITMTNAHVQIHTFGIQPDTTAL